MKGLPRGLLDAPQDVSPQLIFVLAGLGMVLLGVLDLLLPSAFSFELLYLAMVIVVAWRGGGRVAAGLACVSAAFLAAHEWGVAPHRPELLALAWNGLSRLAIFGAAAWGLMRIIQLSRARDRALG